MRVYVFDKLPITLKICTFCTYEIWISFPFYITCAVVPQDIKFCDLEKRGKTCVFLHKFNLDLLLTTRRIEQVKKKMIMQGWRGDRKGSIMVVFVLNSKFCLYDNKYKTNLKYYYFATKGLLSFICTLFDNFCSEIRKYSKRKSKQLVVFDSEYDIKATCVLSLSFFKRHHFLLHHIFLVLLLPIPFLLPACPVVFANDVLFMVAVSDYLIQ